MRSFSIDVIGVTTFVIFRWRKVSAPGAEIDRRVFGPAPAVTNNFSITDLDPVTYYFDTYLSNDGATLNTLLAVYTMDVKNMQIFNERRFYTVGSGVGNAPDPGQSLVDSYLDGKNVTGVFQRAFGYLTPTSEWTRTSGGVDLVSPLSFNTDDVYMVEITYVADAGAGTSGILGLFAGIKTITADTTLDSTYYLNRIKLNGVGPRLVVTMQSISDIPDGKYFYFVDQEDGAQSQTKLVTPDGSFKWAGNTTSEIWVGKGEFLWIEKQGANFEVVQAHSGLTSVYERFSSTGLDHLNAMAEDNALYDADDQPRMYWYLTNKLLAGTFVIDDTLDAGGYVRPANKQGQFIISTTKRKFRMPDTRGLSDKALTRFDQIGWGLDAGRAVDYPGGFEDEMVGPHTHLQRGQKAVNNGGIIPALFRDTDGITVDTAFATKVNDGTSNKVKNFGIINFRRA